MDVIKILAEVKDKVLDAAHYQLLESAYNLQEETITQLKSNNEALKENRQLQAEKTTQLEAENVELKAAIELLENQMPSTVEGELSHVAEGIIAKLFEDDLVNFSNAGLPQALGYNKIAVELALEELEKQGLIRLGSVDPQGSNYYLTTSGKQHTLKIGADTILSAR